jgi:hypothetical protein
VVVALGIQHAKRMSRIVICSLSGSTIFLHIISQTARFSKTVVEYKMCVLIFSTNYVWNIFHSKKNWGRYDRKCILVFMWNARYSCQILMKIEFCRQIFAKYSYMKFHENPSSGSRVVPRGQRERHDKTNCRFSKILQMRLKWPVLNHHTIMHLGIRGKTPCIS